MNCSLCGVAKRATNHWWKMFCSAVTRSYTVVPFETECACEGTLLILCGQECLSKAQSSVLAGQMPRLRDAEGMPA